MTDHYTLAVDLLRPQLMRHVQRMDHAERIRFAEWLLDQALCYDPRSTHAASHAAIDRIERIYPPEPLTEAPDPAESASDAEPSYPEIVPAFQFGPSPWLIKRQMAEAAESARAAVNAEHAGAFARIAEGGAQ